MNRIVGQMRVGNMSTHPEHGEAPGQRTAATILDDITESTCAGRLPKLTPLDFDIVGA